MMTFNGSKTSIVISGLSGRFPESDNVEQLWEHLINGRVLYQPDTFPYPKIFTKTPKSRGALKSIDKFDYSFFGYDQKSANALDPQLRILLEVVYEAIWDAGIAPEKWSGSRTGFYLGSSFEETCLSVGSLDQHADPGQHFSTRVSYHFNWNGPSMTIDTACASSLNALTEAYYGLLNGTCDQAVVAGICLHLKPSVTICFSELDMLSKSGRSRCLDASADGYIRSEAITVVVLQRESQANRVYGKIIGMATSSDGYTKEGITYPCRSVQIATMKQALERSSIDPLTVEYVEAHVTGTAVGDPIETSAIIQAYRGSESECPLTIGCLKGNIGHTEASAGLCAHIKSLKIFQKQLIPMNVGMENPNPRIGSLREGQLITPLTNKPWNGTIIAIDAFGFGGSNTHCLISAADKRHPIDQRSRRRLVCFCNRSKTGLKSMFNSIQSNRESNEYLSLIDSLAFGTTIESGMDWRGFTIVSPKLTKDTNLMGFQFVRSTSHLPIVMLFDFSKSPPKIQSNDDSINEHLEQIVNLCYNHCKNHGYDKKRVDTNPSIVTIIKQLSWVNFLVNKLKINPNLIIGSSIGKIAASYASKQVSLNDCLSLLLHQIKLRSSESSSSGTKR